LAFCFKSDLGAGVSSLDLAAVVGTGMSLTTTMSEGATYCGCDSELEVEGYGVRGYGTGAGCKNRGWVSPGVARGGDAPLLVGTICGGLKGRGAELAAGAGRRSLSGGMPVAANATSEEATAPDIITSRQPTSVTNSARSPGARMDNGPPAIRGLCMTRARDRQISSPRGLAKWENNACRMGPSGSSGRTRCADLVGCNGRSVWAKLFLDDDGAAVTVRRC
jgi:hypothetical protein